MNKMFYGINLKSLRLEKGWSQSKLAKESGLSSSYISRLERGFRANPSMDICSKLFMVLFY